MAASGEVATVVEGTARGPCGVPVGGDESAMDVHGYNGSLEEALTDGFLGEPGPISWREWQRWRSHEGLRPSKKRYKKDGVKEGTTNTYEMHLYNRIMELYHGAPSEEDMSAARLQIAGEATLRFAHEEETGHAGDSEEDPTAVDPPMTRSAGPGPAGVSADGARAYEGQRTDTTRPASDVYKRQDAHCGRVRSQNPSRV